LREQGVLQASSEESIEDLSIDTSISSHCDLDRISGGMGRVSAFFFSLLPFTSALDGLFLVEVVAVTTTCLPLLPGSSGIRVIVFTAQFYIFQSWDGLLP
uniref:Ovule protein n=1 Tax=Hydatigena taeniaeformis TaxID=6205 RepID=A0A0R3XAQ4_HYDTA